MYIFDITFFSNICRHEKITMRNNGRREIPPEMIQYVCSDDSSWASFHQNNRLTLSAAALFYTTTVYLTQVSYIAQF